MMLLGAFSEGTVLIVVAAIGAVPACLSAIVVYLVRDTRRIVNGKSSELQTKVDLLTELLEYARGEDAEPPRTPGDPLRLTRRAKGERE